MAKATTLQDEPLHLIRRDAEVLNRLQSMRHRETEEEKAEKQESMEIVLKDARRVGSKWNRKNAAKQST